VVAVVPPPFLNLLIARANCPLEKFLMSRAICLVLGLASLAAAPGCSSCFGGGNSCRRPSFMEFRSPCGQQAEPCQAPMAAPCGPVCDPCGPAAASGPCCEGAAMPGTVIPGSSGGMPVMPAGEPGTFS
jgi:hypothetical protein